MAVGVETQTNLETNVYSIDQEIRNEQAFYTLLERMRAVKHNERDAGDLFERLMCQVLATTSLYRGHFSRVQLYKNWATEHPEHGHTPTDIGIDLVATLQNPADIEAQYVAIQCKFYKNEKFVPKAELDSFLAASSSKCFAERMLVATNKGWSPNTEQEIKIQEKPVNILNIDVNFPKTGTACNITGRIVPNISRILYRLPCQPRSTSAH